MTADIVQLFKKGEVPVVRDQTPAALERAVEEIYDKAMEKAVFMTRAADPAAYEAMTLEEQAAMVAPRAEELLALAFGKLLKNIEAFEKHRITASKKPEDTS